MFTVNFMRNGQVLYQGQQLVGLFGVLTAVRPGAFSLSLNARLEMNNNPTLDKFLSCLEDVPLQPLMTGFRYYVENFASYEDAIGNMTQTGTCSPHFSIIGGINGQGARLQHSLGVYDEHKVSIEKEELQCTDNSWFVAETNSDFSVPAEKDTDVRRLLIIKDLEAATRSYGSSAPGLFHTLTAHLVKNERSVHSTVMSPKNGEILTLAYDD